MRLSWLRQSDCFKRMVRGSFDRSQNLISTRTIWTFLLSQAFVESLQWRCYASSNSGSSLVILVIPSVSVPWLTSFGLIDSNICSCLSPLPCCLFRISFLGSLDFYSSPYELGLSQLMCLGTSFNYSCQKVCLLGSSSYLMSDCDWMSSILGSRMKACCCWWTTVLWLTRNSYETVAKVVSMSCLISPWQLEHWWSFLV